MCVCARVHVCVHITYHKEAFPIHVFPKRENENVFTGASAKTRYAFSRLVTGPQEQLAAVDGLHHHYSLRLLSLVQQDQIVDG